MGHVGLCCVSSELSNSCGHDGSTAGFMLCCQTDATQSCSSFNWESRVMYTIWLVWCMPCLMLDTDRYGDACDARSALDGQVPGSAAILLQFFVIAGLPYAPYRCRCLQLVFHVHSFTMLVCL